MSRFSDPSSAPSAEFVHHGGRQTEAAVHYPDAPRPWIDLSTGINPVAYPAPRAGREARTRLPDPCELRALEAAAARAFGCPASRVCATPGTQAAIVRLAAMLGARSVAIAGPTYGGHAQAWRSAGAMIADCALPDVDRGAQAVVVVNPNNPDGRTSTAAEILALKARLGCETWLIVDEAFVEAAPELSVAGHAGGRLIVLRSFGKFYGLAGLRLGFVVADEAVIATLRATLGEWPVSADAIAAGLAAYADPAWGLRTRRRLQRDAGRLDALLIGSGFEVVGGTSLFRLASAPHAATAFERLARRGVLVRPFAYNPAWLRFGLPRAPAWPRLRAALETCAP